MSWTVTPTEKTPVDRFGIGSVSLLLHGDGANGSTTIIDSSPTPKTVTAVGNAQISTAQSKFGGASIAFDGNGDRLNLQNTNDLNLETADFTIECWLWLDSTANPGRPDNLKTVTLFSTGTGDTNDISFAVYGNTTTPGIGLQIYKAPSSGFSVVAPVPTNTWANIALVRTGLTLYGFVNGTRYTFGTTAISLFDTGSPKIGMANTTSVGKFTNDFKGYIDDLRITKGVARYTSNFTPPTAPFPNI